MFFEKLGRNADKKIVDAKTQLNEGKSTFNGMDVKEKKWLKIVAFVALGLFCVMGLLMCTGRDENKNQINSVGVETPNQQLYPQTPVVYQNNPDPMVGVIAGMAIGSMMSNGMRYDGRNGYYDKRYKGPAKTIVVNNITNNTVVTPTTEKTVATKSIATQPVTQPTAPTPVQPVSVIKPKSPVTTIDQRKSAIEKQRSVSQKSGFSSFSKKTTSKSSRRK